MRIALSLNLDGENSDPAHCGEMPPGMQRIHRRILRRFSARAQVGSNSAAIVPKLRARVLLDGQDFVSAGKMPPEYRRFYEEMLARLLPVERAVQIVTRAEHANSIKRIVALVFIAAGCAAAIVYLWLHGYYR